MQLIQEGILLKVENIYETEEKYTTEGKKVKEEVYKGFLPEGKVEISNHPDLKKGDTVLVNPYGGSEVASMSTKKHKYLIIESRDILLKK